MEACWSVLVKFCLGGKNDKDATRRLLGWHGCERKMLRQKLTRLDRLDSTSNSQALAIPTRNGARIRISLSTLAGDSYSIPRMWRVED